MKKYSAKYKKWHDRHCQKIPKRKKKREIRVLTINNQFKPKTYTFIAPENFSLINNREETQNFFDKIIKIYNKKRSNIKSSRDIIILEFENVKVITAEALMYLIAITTNLKNIILFNLSMRCHLPKDKTARKLFFDSGFYDYINGNNIFKITPQNSAIQILSGASVDPVTVSKVIDFIKEHSKCCSMMYRNLYTILIEIMTNTVQHAYNNTDFIKLYNWYLYVDVSESINITILDIGEGIPATVARRVFLDTIYTFTPYRSSYIISSALDGNFRSETKKIYRGKGLPHILECFQNKYIDNLCIISSNGSVILNQSKTKRQLYDSKENFLGTIFQISIKNGGENNV